MLRFMGLQRACHDRVPELSRTEGCKGRVSLESELSATPPDTQTQKIQMHLGLACFQVRICPREKMSLVGRKTKLTSPWGPITHSSLGRSWQVAPGCCRHGQRDGPQRFLPGLPLKDTARGRLEPLKGKSCVMF